MCGILAALGLKGTPEENRRLMLKQSKLQRHRGPDNTGCWQSAKGDVVYCFERLHIIDPSDTGAQPFRITRPGVQITWALNSEIYNHDHIKATTLAGVPIVKESKSDSAIIGHLYEKMGDSDDLWNLLDGIFACVLYDEEKGTFMAARDPIGICPLYWGRGADGSYWFSSEMKALQAQCVEFDIFPPGHCFRSRTGKCERFYRPRWLENPEGPPSTSSPSEQPSEAILGRIRDTLIDSVVKRLMSDAPLAMLLSGGLDSSLIAAIAVRHLKDSTNTFDRVHKLHTYSVGIAGSPDLVAARKVADFLGTIHHELTFTVEQGLDALSDLIYHIESYEQVRAAVPMYLLARRIKAMGFKVVLSGEGADEIFGGYLYFHKAPSPAEFHKRAPSPYRSSETIRKVTRLHQWDVLRANKAPFAWGLEPRVPFLDKDFLEVCMGLDPGFKMIDMSSKPDGVHKKMEKYILRKAFDVAEDPYLPAEVLWRQKEQFSDGVGYDWVDGLRDYAHERVSDGAFSGRLERFPANPPTTKEYFLLRSIFEQHYPSESALKTVPTGLSIACSTPEAIVWDKEWANTHEISGRAMKLVHDSGEGFDVCGSKARQAKLPQKSPAPVPNGLPNGSHATTVSQ